MSEQNGRALATVSHAAPPIEWNQAQIDLLKRTVAADAKLANDELALFISVCKRSRLDPFLRQIWPIKSKGRLIIHVAIDGRRAVAQRTGQVDGTDGPYWCGPDAVWRDVWLSGDPPSAAKFTVFKKGHARGYTAVARLSSFKGSSPNWDAMPEHMLAKCAEDHALRKAFPYEMGGMPAYQPDLDADRDPDEALEEAAEAWERMQAPAGVPDALGAYAAAAPNAERQASGRRPRAQPRPAPNREPIGDPVVDSFRGPEPPPADSIDGEGRELGEDEEPTPAPVDVKLRCAALVDEILAAVPTAKPKLPGDSEPLEVWEQWEADTKAKWDAAPSNPKNKQAAK